MLSHWGGCGRGRQQRLPLKTQPGPIPRPPPTAGCGAELISLPGLTDSLAHRDRPGAGAEGAGERESRGGRGCVGGSGGREKGETEAKLRREAQSQGSHPPQLLLCQDPGAGVWLVGLALCPSLAEDTSLGSGPALGGCGRGGGATYAQCGWQHFHPTFAVATSAGSMVPAVACGATGRKGSVTRSGRTAPTPGRRAPQFSRAQGLAWPPPHPPRGLCGKERGVAVRGSLLVAWRAQLRGGPCPRLTQGRAPTGQELVSWQG